MITQEQRDKIQHIVDEAICGQSADAAEEISQVLGGVAPPTIGDWTLFGYMATNNNTCASVWDGVLTVSAHPSDYTIKVPMSVIERITQGAAQIQAEGGGS